VLRKGMSKQQSISPRTHRLRQEGNSYEIFLVFLIRLALTNLLRRRGTQQRGRQIVRQLRRRSNYA